MNRRSLFSLASLLLPGAFDRIAAATIATAGAAEPPPGPDVRSVTFEIGGVWREVALGPNGERSVRVVPRAELYGHLPDPEPAGVNTVLLSVGRIVTIRWNDDPRASCSRCRHSCNADRREAMPGVWVCMFMPGDGNYLGGIAGIPAPVGQAD